MTMEKFGLVSQYLSRYSNHHLNLATYIPRRRFLASNTQTQVLLLRNHSHWCNPNHCKYTNSEESTISTERRAEVIQGSERKIHSHNGVIM